MPRVVLTPSRPPARDPAGAIAPEPDGAATLLADHVELSGDRILTASGGVVVWFEGARLVAERVIYDGRAGTMTIEGPIHLTRPDLAGTPDDTILIADQAQLDEDLQDGILRGALARLFREEKDPIAVIKWKEIYETLETATDRCEDVANIIEGVVLENS